MAIDLFSPSWQRVAQLRPRLRGHAQIHRHVYRGVPTFVLQDHASRRVHHFNASAYEVIGLMDGVRTLDDIWQVACRRLGDAAPSQDETIRLLAQLHVADVLQCEVAPDIDELLRRGARQRRSRWLMALMSPLSIKFPLLDPEPLLVRFLPLYRHAYSWLGALVWIAVVGAALVGAAIHWSELTGDLTDRVLAPHNLVLLWIVFPIIKACHEFGHATAVKRFGGEVHEMGVMLLVFLPVPYVDASSSSAFVDKRARVIVGAAGMLVELVLAALAMAVWLNAEPGVVRSIAYNVIFVAGASTVIFNANPLMRFDGYYILADLIEIPNLRVQSNRYLLSLVDRYLFDTPVSTAMRGGRRERFWLIAFGVASFFYRIFITIAIGIFIAGKYLIIGVLLALWSAIGAFLIPIVRGALFVLASPRLAGRRGRAVALSGGLVVLGAILLFVVPVPLHTRAEGILWVPREAIVAAGSDGFVREVRAHADDMMNPGDPILVLEDSTLNAQVAGLAARVAELESHYQAERIDQRVRAAIALDELDAVRGELARARERAASLEVKSPVAGRLILPHADDLVSQYVRQGSSLAYVVDPNRLTARVIVPQQDADLVRTRTRAVSVRRADDLSEVETAQLVREVPAASTELPNLALSVEGGGKAALDPRERGAPRALQRYFEFELSLPAPQRVELGERVYVRFDHGYEPLGQQWYRDLRQLFLKRLNV